MQTIYPNSPTSTVPQTSAQGAPSPAKADGGVTFRVVLLCLGLAALFGYVIPIVDFKLFNTFLGATHLPPGAIAVLLVLLLVVNPLLRLVSKQWAFTRNETLTVYISCLFSCLIPGHGGESFVIPNLLAPFYERIQNAPLLAVGMNGRSLEQARCLFQT